MLTGKPGLETGHDDRTMARLHWHVVPPVGVPEVNKINALA